MVLKLLFPYFEVNLFQISDERSELHKAIAWFSKGWKCQIDIVKTILHKENCCGNVALIDSNFIKKQQKFQDDLIFLAMITIVNVNKRMKIHKYKFLMIMKSNKIDVY